MPKVSDETDYDQYHRILDLEPGAKLWEIEESWKLLVNAWHPGKFVVGLRDKATRKLQDINNARDALKQYWTTYGKAPPTRAPYEGGPSSPRSQPDTAQARDYHREAGGKSRDTTLVTIALPEGTRTTGMSIITPVVSKAPAPWTDFLAKGRYFTLPGMTVGGQITVSDHKVKDGVHYITLPAYALISRGLDITQLKVQQG